MQQQTENYSSKLADAIAGRRNAVNPATGKPWPVIDRSLELAKRKAAGVKRRYRLLAGMHIEQVQVGVDNIGDPVLQDVVYRAGSIIESTEDLCKSHNAGGTGAKDLAYRKFELVPDGIHESDGKFVWDPSAETIDQFLARTGAKQPDDANGNTAGTAPTQTPPTKPQPAAKGRIPNMESLSVQQLKEIAEEREIDLEKLGATKQADIVKALRAAGV